MKLPNTSYQLKKAAVSAVAFFAIACAAVLAAPVAAHAEAVAKLTYISYGATTYQEFSSMSELMAKAADESGDITVDLYCDWDASDGTITIPSGRSYTFNLHGHMINRGLARTNSSDAWYGYRNGQVFTVEKSATLTVNGGDGDEAATEHKGWFDDSKNDAYHFWKYDGTGSAVLTGGLITGGASATNWTAGGINAKDGSTVNLNNVTVAGNVLGNAHCGGGGICLGKNCTLNLAGTKVCYNHNETDGGGIYDSGDSCDILIKNGSSVSNNLSCALGGGIFINGNDAKLTVEGSAIDNNYAYKDGGGIYHNGKRGSVTMGGGASVSGNVTASDGGGIYDYYNGTTFSIASSAISNNIASGDGGGLYLNDSCDFTLAGSTATISGNSAKNGAGIYADKDTINIYVKDGATVKANTASEYGGGIYNYAQNSTILVDAARICENTAATYGGGIYNATSGIYSYFGADYVRKATVELENGGSIDTNTAAHGGGLAVGDGTYDSVVCLDFYLKSDDKSGTIYGNTANENGAGVFFRGCYDEFLVTGITFTQNKAEGYLGGAIYYLGWNWWDNDKSCMDLVDCTVSNNKGAGVFCRSGSVNLWGTCVIADNTGTDGRYEYDLVLQGAANHDLVKTNQDTSGFVKDCSLSSDSRIGVYVQDSKYDGKEVVGEYATDEFSSDLDLSKVIYSNNDAYTIGYDDGEGPGDSLYLHKSNGEYHTASVWGASDTSAAADRTLSRTEGSLVKLQSSEFMKDGALPRYWEAEGLGSTTVLYPDADGVASFAMPAGDVKLVAHYGTILSKLSLGVSDTAAWSKIGYEGEGELSLSSVTFTGSDDSEVTPTAAEAGSTRLGTVTSTLESEIPRKVKFTVRIPESLLEEAGMLADPEGETSLDVEGSAVSTKFGDGELSAGTVSYDAEKQELVAEFECTFTDPKSYMVTVNTYSVNDVDAPLSASAGVAADDEGNATVTAPRIAGMKFLQWNTGCPEGADYTSETLTFTGLTGSTEVTALYVPIVNYYKIEGASTPTVGEAFPSELVRTTAKDATGAQMTSSGAKISWTRADGAELTEETVQASTTYVASGYFYVTAPSGGTYMYRAPSKAGVICDNFDIENVGIEATETPDGSTRMIKVSFTYTVTTAADASFDSVVTEYDDVDVVFPEDCLATLKADTSVTYKLKNGEYKEATVSWDTSSVPRGQTSGTFEVKGTFADEAGESHEVSRTFNLVGINAPAPNKDSNVRYYNKLDLGFVVGDEIKSGLLSVMYCVVPANSEQAIATAALDDEGTSNGYTFSEYTGDVTLTQDSKVLVYSQVKDEDGDERTSEVVEYDYTVVPTHEVTVGEGSATDEDKHELVDSAAAEGDTVLVTANESQGGKTFLRWKVVSGEAELEDATSPVTSFTMEGTDVQLVAEYGDQTCTVSFECGEGSEVESQTVAVGGKVEKPADPTRDGYKFAGWYADEALTSEYDFSAAVEGDLTLYAKWEKDGSGDDSGDKGDDSGDKGGSGEDSGDKGGDSGDKSDDSGDKGGSDGSDGQGGADGSSKGSESAMPQTGDAVCGFGAVAVVGVAVAAAGVGLRRRR